MHLNVRSIYIFNFQNFLFWSDTFRTQRTLTRECTVKLKDAISFRFTVLEVHAIHCLPIIILVTVWKRKIFQTTVRVVGNRITIGDREVYASTINDYNKFLIFLFRISIITWRRKNTTNTICRIHSTLNSSLFTSYNKRGEKKNRNNFQTNI